MIRFYIYSLIFVSHSVFAGTLTSSGFEKNYKLDPSGNYLAILEGKKIPNMDAPAPYLSLLALTPDGSNYDLGNLITFHWSLDGKSIYLVNDGGVAQLDVTAESLLYMDTRANPLEARFPENPEKSFSSFEGGIDSDLGYIPVTHWVKNGAIYEGDLQYLSGADRLTVFPNEPISKGETKNTLKWWISPNGKPIYRLHYTKNNDLLDELIFSDYSGNKQEDTRFKFNEYSPLANYNSAAMYGIDVFPVKGSPRAYFLKSFDEDTSSILISETGHLSDAKTIFRHDRYDIDRVVFDQNSGIVGVDIVSNFIQFVPLSTFGEIIVNKAQEIAGDTSDFGLFVHDASILNRQAVFTIIKNNSREDYLISDGKVIQLGNTYHQKSFSTDFFSFLDSNGNRIEGYLSQPTEKCPENPIAVVIHGGPAVRDYRKQSLLSRKFLENGYSTLRVNYMGSAGYGTKFFSSTGSQLLDVVPKNIVDSLNFSRKKYSLNPKKVILAGGSYGGLQVLNIATSPIYSKYFDEFLAINPLYHLTQVEQRAKPFPLYSLFSKDYFSMRNVSSELRHREISHSKEIRVVLGNLDSVVENVNGETFVSDYHQLNIVLMRLENEEHGLSSSALDRIVSYY